MRRFQNYLKLMKKHKGSAAKSTTAATEGVAQKKGRTTAKVHTPTSSSKRKNPYVEVVTNDPTATNKCKKTQVEPNPSFAKVWVPSTMDGKGKPIFERAKAMSSPAICKMLIRVMILPADYDVATTMSREDIQCKLNRARYQVSSISFL